MDAKQYEADIQYKGSFITECSFDNNIIDAVTNCELTHQITVSVSEQIPVDDLTFFFSFVSFILYCFFSL